MRRVSKGEARLLLSRHCEERSDEAIQTFCLALDCFAALAMTSLVTSVPQAPIAIFGSASALAASSRSARRYSTGITLRNFGA